MNANEVYADNGLAWAVSRWEAEVKNRPLVNVHRRTLDDTWRQVIRYFEGDPEKLVGPAHDDLVAAATSGGRMTASRIIWVHHEYPPVPFRDCDWAATFDGYEPPDPIGRGATEEAAIADLLMESDYQGSVSIQRRA